LRKFITDSASLGQSIQQSESKLLQGATEANTTSRDLLTGNQGPLNGEQKVLIEIKVEFCSG